MIVVINGDKCEFDSVKDLGQAVIDYLKESPKVVIESED